MKHLLLFCLAAALCCAFPLDATAQVTNAAAPSDVTAVPASTPAPTAKAPATLAQWSTASSLPVQKCYHGAVYHDGYIYVFGGLGGNLRFDSKCYRMDVSTGIWSSIASLPLQRGLTAIQAVGDKIYIIGGYSATSPFTVQAQVLEYDPAQDSYMPKATMPTPVYGAGSFVYNDRIFVLGGGTTGWSTSIDEIQIYDPFLDAWTTSTSVTPYPSWGSGVAGMGSTVLLVGGSRYENGSGVYGAWAYRGEVMGNDIIWSQISDYPGGSIMRYGAGSDGTLAYFAAGWGPESQNSGPPVGRCYAYDVARSEWIIKDAKPTPVYFAGPMVFDGVDKMYMMGGNDAPSSVTAAVEALDINAEGGAVAVFDRTELELWLKSGGGTSACVTLSNGGSAALTWNANVSDGGTWLSLATAGGTLQPSESTAIELVIQSPPGVGTHSGTVEVTTNDPAQPAVDILVTVRVQDDDVDTDVNVLLEEGTGTWCGYCPYGADTLHAMIERFPGRVFGISYHGGSATEPMQTPATGFWTNVIELGGWPQGSINRIIFDGESKAALSRGAWGTRIREVLETRRSPISINVLSKSYDAGTKRVDMQVEVFFHRDLSDPIRLNVAQLQDSMNYSQSFYPQGGGSVKLYPYYHNHVLRQLLPTNPGEVVSGGAAVPSQTSVVKTFSFTSVDSTISTSRFIIFAHVSDGSNFGEILQSEEVSLLSFVTDVQPLPANAGFALLPNYPNPFGYSSGSPSTMISFDVPVRSSVSVRVCDALGREVARIADGVYGPGRHSASFSASSLPAGVYFVRMQAGDFSQTQRALLVR